MNMNKTDLICIAVIGGAFGVAGEVRIRPFTAVAEDCFGFGPMLSEDGVVILSARKHRIVKDGFAVFCDEIDTPEQANALRGTKLYGPREALPEPDEDEFYYSDLVGMQVKTVDGKTAGKVVALHNFGAGDLLEIKPKQGGSFYHSFTKEAVPKVDMTARRIIIKVVEAENGKAPNDYKDEEE